MKKSEKLLLVSCCAPCSVGVISDLKKQGVDFTVLFYNPNIRPEKEYIKRRNENLSVCNKLKVPFKELHYNPKIWEMAVKGFENELGKIIHK